MNISYYISYHAIRPIYTYSDVGSKTTFDKAVNWLGLAGQYSVHPSDKTRKDLIMILLNMTY